jgi:hypothetical protein
VWTVYGLGKMQDKVKEVSVRKVIVLEFVTLDGVMEGPLANPPHLSRLLYYSLPCVAPYCARGGVTVVSDAPS